VLQISLATWGSKLKQPRNLSIHSNSPCSDSKSSSWPRNSQPEFFCSDIQPILFLPAVQRLIDLAFRGAVSCSTWSVCTSTPTQRVLGIVKWDLRRIWLMRSPRNFCGTELRTVLEFALTQLFLNCHTQHLPIQLSLWILWNYYTMRKLKQDLVMYLLYLPEYCISNKCTFNTELSNSWYSQRTLSMWKWPDYFSVIWIRSSLLSGRSFDICTLLLAVINHGWISNTEVV